MAEFKTGDTVGDGHLRSGDRGTIARRFLQGSGDCGECDHELVEYEHVGDRFSISKHNLVLIQAATTEAMKPNRGHHGKLVRHGRGLFIS